MGVLGYADDAALLSHSTEKMSVRLSKVSRGSREDADMDLHKGKTKTMHVCKQEHMAPPSIEAIKKTEEAYGIQTLLQIL